MNHIEDQLYLIYMEQAEELINRGYVRDLTTEQLADKLFQNYKDNIQPYIEQHSDQK